MPSGPGPNLAAAPPGSPDAFRRTPGDAAGALVLPHRPLDGSARATPQVSRVDDRFDAPTVGNDVPLALAVRPGRGGGPGRWHGVAGGPGSPPFPAETAFDVRAGGGQARPGRDDMRFVQRFDP